MEIQGQHKDSHDCNYQVVSSNIQTNNSQYEINQQQNQQIINQSLSFFTNFLSNKQNQLNQQPPIQSKSSVLQNSMQIKNALSYIKALAQQNSPYLMNYNMPDRQRSQEQKSNDSHSKNHDNSQQIEEKKMIQNPSSRAGNDVINISQTCVQDNEAMNSNKIQKKSGKFVQNNEQLQFKSPFQDNQQPLFQRKAQKMISNTNQEKKTQNIIKDVPKVKTNFIVTTGNKTNNNIKPEITKDSRIIAQQNYFINLQSKSKNDLRSILRQYSETKQQKQLNQIANQINKTHNIVLSLKQNFIKLDTQALQMIEKQQLYQIDYNKVAFEKHQPLIAKYKGYLDIIRLFSQRKITQKQFQQGIMAQSSQDLRIIILISFKINQYLNDQQNQQFINTMKISFGISTKVQQSAIKQLYIKLIRIIKQFKNVQTSNLQKISLGHLIEQNNQEIYIIKLYLQTKRFKSILQFVQEQYHFYFQHQQKKITISTLKCWLENIVKKGLNKLQSQYRKYQKQKVKDICFNDHQFHLILRSSHFQKIRLAILEYYVSKETYLMDIYDLMKMIQEGLTVKSSKIYPNKREIPDESNKKRKTTKVKYPIDNEEGFDDEESSSKQNDDAIYTSKAKLNRLQKGQQKKQLTLTQSYMRTGLKIKPQRKLQLRNSSNNPQSYQQLQLGNFARRQIYNQNNMVQSITNKIKLQMNSSHRRR